MTDNAIVHFDISGPNEDAVRSFYQDLLGWKVDPLGPGYALVETPAGLRGSLVEAEARGSRWVFPSLISPPPLRRRSASAATWSCRRRTTAGLSKLRSETPRATC
jgi:hypothetical protein